MRRGPGFVASDVDPATVLSGLDADEPLVVVLAHVAELVLVPRVPTGCENPIKQCQQSVSS